MHWTAKAFCIHFADIVFNVMQGLAVELRYYMHYTTIQALLYK